MTSTPEDALVAEEVLDPANLLVAQSLADFIATGDPRLLEVCGLAEPGYEGTLVSPTQVLMEPIIEIIFY